jgi:hypothetical protein
MTRHDKTRQDTTRHDKTRQDTTRHDKKRQDTTRHDKTRQETTRHDKTRQDTKHRDIQGMLGVLVSTACSAQYYSSTFEMPAYLRSSPIATSRHSLHFIALFSRKPMYRATFRNNVWPSLSRVNERTTFFRNFGNSSSNKNFLIRERCYRCSDTLYVSSTMTLIITT